MIYLFIPLFQYVSLIDAIIGLSCISKIQSSSLIEIGALLNGFAALVGLGLGMTEEFLHLIWWLENSI